MTRGRKRIQRNILSPPLQYVSRMDNMPSILSSSADKNIPGKYPYCNTLYEIIDENIRAADPVVSRELMLLL